MSDRRSIIVVGGGAVGLTVAALLASGRYAEAMRVQVLEPRAVGRWDSRRVDLRVYALSRASQQILHRAGAWRRIIEARASPYRRMHVWERAPLDGLGTLQFDSADIGEPDLGHIVEDGLLREAVLQRLDALANVQLLFGVELKEIRLRDRGVEVLTDTGETLEAGLLIAADGSESRVRNLLALPVSAMSYHQSALVTHAATELHHEETAWQRFLPTGPLALLPLLDGRCSIVWSTTSEHAEDLMNAAEEAFIEELETASQRVLGSIEGISARARFPLRVLHARRYCCSRVALVGDAAHTVHPLAGQGMNLGLLDAAALVEVIENAWGAGEDPGDLRVLRRYERDRKGENLKMLLALDGLNRLFRLPGAGPLRTFGLSAVNALTPAKRALMREALGLTARPVRSAQNA